MILEIDSSCADNNENQISENLENDIKTPSCQIYSSISIKYNLLINNGNFVLQINPIWNNNMKNL